MEEEEGVKSSELSADNQEEKALDVWSTISAEQEVSIPALLAVIRGKFPETAAIQEEVRPFAILFFALFEVIKYAEMDIKLNLDKS